MSDSQVYSSFNTPEVSHDFADENKHVFDHAVQLVVCLEEGRAFPPGVHWQTHFLYHRGHDILVPDFVHEMVVDVDPRSPDEHRYVHAGVIMIAMIVIHPTVVGSQDDEDLVLHPSIVNRVQERSNVAVHNVNVVEVFFLAPRICMTLHVQMFEVDKCEWALGWDENFSQVGAGVSCNELVREWPISVQGRIDVELEVEAARVSILHDGMVEPPVVDCSDVDIVITLFEGSINAWERNVKASDGGERPFISFPGWSPVVIGGPRRLHRGATFYGHPGRNGPGLERGVGAIYRVRAFVSQSGRDVGRP